MEIKVLTVIARVQRFRASCVSIHLRTLLPGSFLLQLPLEGVIRNALGMPLVPAELPLLDARVVPPPKGIS